MQHLKANFDSEVHLHEIKQIIFRVVSIILGSFLECYSIVVERFRTILRSFCIVVSVHFRFFGVVVVVIIVFIIIAVFDPETIPSNSETVFSDSERMRKRTAAQMIVYGALRKVPG